MCGRRVEGWRGLLPVGELDLGGPPGATSGQGHAPVEPAAPREVGHEEPTRPIRPSASLAAASASSYDEESRRTTGEVPSVGHEVRAKAPDQRVHTSPIGNILPTEILQSLDAAAVANSRLPIAPDAGRHRSSAPGTAGAGSLADGPSSPGRPTVPISPGASAVASASGRTDRPSSPGRLSPSSPGRAASPSSAGQRSRDSASAAHAPSGERLRAPSQRAERDPRPERSTRRVSPRPRRPELPELPELPPSGSTPAAAPPDADLPRHPAPDAPQPVGFEPTHFIARRQSGTRLVRALRTLIWALLWLGLGGAVAFSVVAVVRRGQPAPLPPPASKPAPPRRTPPPPPKPTTPAAPRGPAAALPSPTRAHDLVVPIPAAGGRPVAPPRPEPGAQLAPRPPAAPDPSAAPPPVAPTVATPEPLLDPQEQAAAEHTMSNIEFVVSERVAQVRACYERAVRSLGADAPGGRIEVSVTLTEDGQATRISTIDNTVGNAQLAGCLEQRIAEWRFPRPLGLARTFRLPFTFSPSPQQSGPRPRR